MRAVLLSLVLLPAPALAETFTLPSRATAATVYNATALVTHDLSVTLPAGAHQLVLPDLPPNMRIDQLRVQGTGVTLGAIRYREDLTPPRAAQDSPEITAAKARIEEIEAQIEEVTDRAARQNLSVEAAQDRIAFLTGLAGSHTLPTSPDALSAMAQMIGTQTLAAREEAFEALLAVRETRAALEDLNTALKAAQQALAALVPEPQNRPLLVLDVVAPEAVTAAPIAITFPVAAGWMPTYDLRLSLDPTPSLELQRGAAVTQNSGENWSGIALTLSTQSVDGTMDPRPLYPDLRRIFDEDELFRTTRAAPSALMDEAPIAEMALASPAMSKAQTQGLSVTYAWSDPVDVASGADEVRLPFDTLTLEAEIVARAVPLQSETGFMVAKVTNTSDAALLGSNDAPRFVDGGLVGTGAFAAIQPGGTAEIGFGRIDGLQLTRRVLNRGEADRGIISRSNEITEEVEITLENRTARTWDVELRDRVPYSEQEDLEIDYSAEPRPDVDGVDDKRGMLQWNIEMPAGNTATVSTEYRMTWPEGQRLR